MEDVLTRDAIRVVALSDAVDDALDGATSKQAITALASVLVAHIQTSSPTIEERQQTLDRLVKLITLTCDRLDCDGQA